MLIWPWSQGIGNPWNCLTMTKASLSLLIGRRARFEPRQITGWEDDGAESQHCHVAAAGSIPHPANHEEAGQFGTLLFRGIVSGMF